MMHDNITLFHKESLDDDGFAGIIVFLRQS